MLLTGRCLLGVLCSSGRLHASLIQRQRRPHMECGFLQQYRLQIDSGLAVRALLEGLTLLRHNDSSHHVWRGVCHRRNSKWSSRCKRKCLAHPVPGLRSTTTTTTITTMTTISVAVEWVQDKFEQGDMLLRSATQQVQHTRHQRATL